MHCARERMEEKNAWISTLLASNYLIAVREIWNLTQELTASVQQNFPLRKQKRRATFQDSIVSSISNESSSTHFRHGFEDRWSRQPWGEGCPLVEKQISRCKDLPEDTVQ